MIPPILRATRFTAAATAAITFAVFQALAQDADPPVERPMPLPAAPAAEESSDAAASAEPPQSEVRKVRSRANRKTRQRVFEEDILTLPRRELTAPPYRFIGYLGFRSGSEPYFGSGTIVRPRSVLTCAHNLWEPRAGWSTNVRFERQRYRGTRRGTFRPTSLFIQPGYMEASERSGDESNAAFANDIAWMVFPTQFRNGRGAPFLTRYNALTGRAYNEAVGYGEGTVPRVGIPTLAYRQVGNTPYFLNNSYDHLGGMSGGPILARLRNRLVVVGVVVSSGGGIRAIDRDVLQTLNSLP